MKKITLNGQLNCVWLQHLLKSGYDCKYSGESIFGSSVLWKLDMILCFESNTIYGA